MSTEGGRKSAGEGKAAILIVEPDVIVRLSVAEYLRDCDHLVLECHCAEDALAVLGSGRVVDIVLAEVRLPGMSGFDLAKKIRADYPAVGIMLSSSVQGTAQKAGDLCDDGPIQKPYEPADVLRRINLLRERKRTSKPS